MTKLDRAAAQAFKLQRASDNVLRLRLVSAVIIGVLLWFGVIHVVFLMAMDRDLPASPLHFLLYGCLFGSNLYMLIRSFRFDRADADPEGRSRNIERVVTGYAFLLLLLGASISWTDQDYFGHVMVYALTMLLTSAFLLTDVMQLAWPLGLSTALLLVGLIIPWPPAPERVRSVQELVAYVPIAFLISRVMHSTYFSAWHGNFRLQQKMRENERLTEELRDMNVLLETLARTDEVTGIANRRGLRMHINKLLATADGELQLALILIDIDLFKGYNDLHGHRQGDHVLAAVAEVLRKIADETSTFVARWGGEEFLYVAAGLDKEKTLAVCRRIEAAMREAAIPHGNSRVSKFITVSQGACAMRVRDADDVATCLWRADRALYKMKKAGRNGFAYFDGVTV